MKNGRTGLPHLFTLCHIPRVKLMEIGQFQSLQKVTAVMINGGFQGFYRRLIQRTARQGVEFGHVDRHSGSIQPDLAAIRDHPYPILGIHQAPNL
ncbi:MAG: hypothetical protein V7677_05495 [Motiliproteus sp.]